MSISDRARKELGGFASLDDFTSTLGELAELMRQTGATTTAEEIDRAVCIINALSSPAVDDELVERLRGLLEKATKGPWVVVDCPIGEGPYDFYLACPQGALGYAPKPDQDDDTFVRLTQADAALIVEAVNALPALLDRLAAPRHDRDTIRREAFEEAAALADEMLGSGYATLEIVNAIRALKETPA